MSFQLPGLASRVKTAADMLSVSELHKGQVENELCFLIGSKLGVGATAASAFAAVEAAVPAFEINQKRLPGGVAAGLRVADDLSNWGIGGVPVQAYRKRAAAGR